jgi:hypothetical protein
MTRNQRFELTWIGKENRPRLEPRILIEDAGRSHHALFQNRIAKSPRKEENGKRGDLGCLAVPSSNVPHYFGRIDPNRFTPYPKNPTICKFMLQMGRYEELGSGVRRVNQYLPHYAPGAGKPVFEDGEMFTVTVPIAAVAPQVGEQVAGQVTGQVTDQVARLLQVLRGDMTRPQLQTAIGLQGLANFRGLYLVPALKHGLVEMTIPDKPNSRLQKYRLTDKGIRYVLGKGATKGPNGPSAGPEESDINRPNRTSQATGIGSQTAHTAQKPSPESRPESKPANRATASKCKIKGE